MDIIKLKQLNLFYKKCSPENKVPISPGHPASLLLYMCPLNSQFLTSRAQGPMFLEQTKPRPNQTWSKPNLQPTQPGAKPEAKPKMSPQELCPGPKAN